MKYCKECGVIKKDDGTVFRYADLERIKAVNMFCQTALLFVIAFILLFSLLQ